MYETVKQNHDALTASTYPKLLFCSDPGGLTPTAMAEDYAKRLHNCRLVKLGPGKHYLQEDHPDTIGEEVAIWVREHGK